MHLRIRHTGIVKTSLMRALVQSHRESQGPERGDRQMSNSVTIPTTLRNLTSVCVKIQMMLLGKKLRLSIVLGLREFQGSEKGDRQMLNSVAIPTTL